jgi:uncharacterized membrane protein YfcA
MLGVGGAVIMLPLLTAFAGLTLKEASNVTIAQVIAASIISVVAYQRRGLVYRSLALHMGLASVIGGLAGGVGSHALSSLVLEWLFLVVVLVAIGLLLLPVRETAVAGYDKPPFNRLQAVGLGAMAGTLAGLLGAGGGFLIVPLMIGTMRMPTRLAIGTSPAVILISSSAGLMGKVASGQMRVDLALALVASAGPCAYLGTLIGRRLPARTLRILLGVVLVAIAVRGVLKLLGYIE